MLFLWTLNHKHIEQIVKDGKITPQLLQLKGFVQKGHISHFWLIFIFLQDRANFWQTDLF